MFNILFFTQRKSNYEPTHLLVFVRSGNHRFSSFIRLIQFQLGIRTKYLHKKCEIKVDKWSGENHCIKPVKQPSVTRQKG